MSYEDHVAELLNLLPLPLRIQIQDSMRRQIEELEARGLPTDERDRAVVETLLQEIFLNVIIPVGFASRITTLIEKWDRTSFTLGLDGRLWTGPAISNLKDMSEDFYAIVREFEFDFVDKYFSSQAWKGESQDWPGSR